MPKLPKSFRIIRYWAIAFATTSSLAFYAPPVHAEPISAIIGLVGTISAGASAATVLGNLAMGLLTIGANMLLAKLMAPNEKKKGIKERIDSGGDLPLSIILGERATAGKLVYVNETGDSTNNLLTLVISLSEVAVTSFSNIIWINGEKCEIDIGGETPDDAPTPGFYPIVQYDKLDDDDYNRQYCWVKFYDGTQTTPDPYLTTAFGLDEDKPWTEDMIGRGCAYAIVVCRHSTKGIWSGIPEFKFVVRGIKLYDISKDTTAGGSGAHRWNDKSTWTFSENPKVMIYNIIRGISDINGDWIWGGQNVADYQMPADYWIAAIAHCNGTVTTFDGRTVNRYTANCEVSVDTQPIEVIKELDKTCAGYTMEYGGLWKTYAGPPGASILSITDDDVIITEQQTDDLYRPMQETYNGARATYTSVGSGWASKDAKPYNNSDYKTEDDDLELIADMSLPYVTEYNQVLRLMRLATKDSRQARVHIIQLAPYAYIGEPFDVVSWTSARNGYEAKKFTIQSIDDLPNCNQLVVLRETNPADYDYDIDFDEPETVGILTPIRPGALALEFTVVADQVDRDGGGKDKPAIKIDWTWGLKDIDVRLVTYEVRKSAALPKVIAQGSFRNVDEGTRTITSAAFRFKNSYQVRMYAQPERTWRKSFWTAWKDVTLFDIDIPGQPDLTRVSDLADDGTLDFYLDIDWVNVSQTVTYVVRVISDGKTRYHDSNDNSIRIPVTSGKTYTVDVRAIAADGGTKGDWSTASTITVTKKNTAPTTPAGLTLTADFKMLSLSWTQSPDADYSRTRIYRSTTNNFLAATLVHQKSGNGWTDDGLPNLATRYYWITHIDRSGNESAKWPTSNTAGINGTTTVITDDDTDGTSPPTPTGLGVVQRTFVNGDGKVDIQLVVSWTGIANKKATYIVRVDDGTDFDYFHLKDIGPGTATVHRKKIPAVSGTLYSISVAAVNGSGTIGSYTSNVTITPNKKSILPTAPTGLTLVADFKKLILTWPKAVDADYSKTRIYRATTNDFTLATEVKEIKASGWTDDGLPNLATRYYWITFIDRSNNESAKWPVSNTGGISGTTTVITDNDTDGTSPPTPTGLTLSQKTDLNGDGKVEIRVKVTWTAIANAKANYVVRINDGTDFSYHDAQNTAYIFDGISGTTYTVSVAAVNGTGTIGSYTSNVTITPSKKATAPTAPTTLTAVGKVGRIVLRWTKSPDTDYRRTNIYAASVNNFSTSASLLDDVTASKFEEGNLGNSVTRYYWITHEDRSGNESAKFPVSNTGGVSATTVLVADADTDNTAPIAPTGLTLTRRQTIDEDGKVVLFVSMTCDASATGISAKGRVMFEVDDGTDKFYVRADYEPSVTTIGRFSARSNVLYTVRARAIAFNGAKGAWTSTSTITPAKKAAGGVTTASGLTVTPKPKSMRLKWTRCTDPDYKETVILRGGAEIDRIKGSGYTDTSELTVNTSYTYSVVHVDTSDNPGTASSGVAGTYRAAAAADIGERAITAGKVSASDPGGLVLNGKFIDGDQGWVFAANTSVVADTPTSPGGAFILRTSDRDGAFSDWFDIDNGEAIFARAYVYANSIEDVSLMLHTTDDANGNNGFQTFATTGVKTTWTQLQGTIVCSNANARRGRILLQCNKTQGTTLTTWNYWGKVKARRAAHRQSIPPLAISSTELDDTAVIEAKLNDNAVTPRKTKRVDSTNLIRNADCDDVTLWNGSVALATGPTALVSESANVLSVPATTGLMDIYTDADIAVKAGKKYYVNGFSGPSNGVSCLHRLYVNWYSMDAAGVTTYITGSTIGAVTGTVVTEKEGVVTAPANARRAQLVARKDASAGAADFVLYGPVFRRAAAADMIPDGDVTDGKTDQTAPGVVSAPTLTIRQNVDGDGVINTKIKIAWSAPSTTVPIRYYEIRIDDGTDIEYVQSKNLSHMIKGAVIGKTYTVAISAMSFNGVQSAFTNTSTSSPVAFTTAIATPSAPGAVQVPKGILVTWTRCTNKDYKETIINRVGTGEIGRVKANRFTDVNLVVGTGYTYTIQHVTNSDVASTASTASTPSVTYQLIQDADTDQTVPAAAGIPTLTPVTADIDLDGTLDTGLTIAFTAASGTPRAIKKYRVELWRATTAGTTGSLTGYSFFDDYTTKALSKRVKLNGAYFYKASVVAITANDVETASAFTSVGVQPPAKTAAPTVPGSPLSSGYAMRLFVSWDGVTDKDIASTEVYTATSAVFVPSAASVGDVIVPANPTALTSFVYIPQSFPRVYYPWVRNINKSGVKSAWVSAGSATVTEWVEDQLGPNTINDNFFSSNGTSQAVGAGSKTKIEEVVITYPVGSAQLEVFGMFRKVTAGSHTMDITIENSGGVVFKTVQNYNINAADGYGFIQATIDAPAAAGATIRMYVLCASAINVNNTKLDVNVRKR